VIKAGTWSPPRLGGRRHRLRHCCRANFTPVSMFIQPLRVGRHSSHLLCRWCRPPPPQTFKVIWRSVSTSSWSFETVFVFRSVESCPLLGPSSKFSCPSLNDSDYSKTPERGLASLTRRFKHGVCLYNYSPSLIQFIIIFWCTYRASCSYSVLSWPTNAQYTYIHIRTYIQVSQEESAKLRESVPYVKVYRYNPKHLYPNLNGYGDNG
jgi:hypothetical protein